MPSYSYKAMDRSGREVQGQIQALSPEAVRQELSRKGRFVHEIKLQEETPSQEISGPISPVLSKGSSRKVGCSRSDRLQFIQQLATALRSHLSVVRALEVVGRQYRRWGVPAICRRMIDIVNSGESLSYAFSLYPRLFTRLDISLVSIGERTGNLAESMAQLGQLREREEETRNEIFTAMLYPVFVLVLGLVSVMIVAGWILPHLLEMMVGEAGAELPVPTRMLMAVSFFLRSRYGIFSGVLCALLVLLFYVWQKTLRGRYVLDRIKLSIPLLRKVISQWAISRLSRTLGILTGRGIPILEALAIVRDCMGNEVLALEIDKMAQKVRGGAGLAESLRESKYVPPLLVQIVAMGEETGQLSELLLEAADAFERNTRQSMRRFMILFPAVLICILAAVIGFIVAATLLPIIEIQTTLPGL